MNKFFQKFGGGGGDKKKGEGMEVRGEPQNLEDEILAEMKEEAENEEETFNATEEFEMEDDEGEEEEDEEDEEDEEEDVCKGGVCSASTPTPAMDMGQDSSAPQGEISNGSSSSWAPSTTTTICLFFTLVLVALGLLFRRKTRRQRRMWKRDNRTILGRVDEVMEQLEARDEEVDVLQQKIKLQQQEASQTQERLTQQSTQALQAKEEECQDLQGQLAELQARQKETTAQLEKMAADLQRYVEGQQDHECQLLEQKLQNSQLATALTDREAQVEELQHANHKLQQKIKSDAAKAEQIIQNMTSERDERYAILQQENDAIKTTVMGMLKQTQARYDEDKVLLKKEMRKRDDKIRTLQQDLWQSNALLKRVKEEKGVNENLSQSFRTLIDDIKETKELASQNGLRRSSTYDAAETILEGDEKCEELKQLETMLQKSNSVD